MKTDVNIFGGFEESDRCSFGKLEQIERSSFDPIYDLAYITLNNGAIIIGLLSEFVSNHIPDVGKKINKATTEIILKTNYVNTRPLSKL